MPPLHRRGPQARRRFALLGVLAAACAALLIPFALPAAPARADTPLVTAQAEATAKSGCTALQATQAVYYCNNDYTSGSYTFPQAGRYRIAVSGASSADNTAGISVYVGGQYRDMLQEWDPTLTDAAVQAKLDTYWNSLFASTDDDKRLYYTAGSNAQGLWPTSRTPATVMCAPRA